MSTGLAITLVLLSVVTGVQSVSLAISGQREVSPQVRIPDRLSPPEHGLSGIQLAKGKFLVASRNIKDPRFMETVILLIQYDLTGTIGLVINRPTEVKLSAVFPEIKGLQQRADSLYGGGPVARDRIFLLIRSRSPIDGSHQVFGDVYVGTNMAALGRMVEGSGKGKRFRVYAGYAGWVPGQLEREVSRGDWHVLQADAETIFDKAPSEIWPELIRRSSVLHVKETMPEFGSEPWSCDRVSIPDSHPLQALRAL